MKKSSIFNNALNFISTPPASEWDGYAIELTNAVLAQLYAAGELNEEKLQLIVFETHPFEVAKLVSSTKVATFFKEGNERMGGAVLVIARRKLFPDMEAEAALN